MSRSLRTLIVDDEAGARTILKHLLTEHKDVEVVAEASSMDEAMVACLASPVDLILLDIGLGSEAGGEGFKVAELAARSVSAPSIVFVTGEPAYALDAHEHHPAYFLLKPVERELLALALQRVRAERAARDQGLEPTLALRFAEVNAYRESIRSTAYLRPRDILFFQTHQYKDDGSRDGTLLVALPAETLMGVRERLDILEGRLSPYRFFRIHASCLINLRYLTRLRP
jgi:DNA-binding LytR/AlgR family response regulator